MASLFLAAVVERDPAIQPQLRQAVQYRELLNVQPVDWVWHVLQCALALQCLGLAQQTALLQR